VKKPRRLVVRGVNWLGDAVMCMPALARLREALPDTHITLFTEEKLLDLWLNHPALNGVIPFQKQQGVGHASRALRQGQFDAALILPNSFRSAFESWLAGIPVRIGYGRKLLLTDVIQPRAEHIEMRKNTVIDVKRLVSNFPDRARDQFPIAAHHLHQYLRLVSFFGASEEPMRPSIDLSEEEFSAFKRKFGVTGSRPTIGLNAGAEYGPAKRWPIERFIQAALKVATQVNVQWLIFGGPGDKETTMQIENGIRRQIGSVLNLAGRTTLRELAAGLSLCDAVLTNDTGPMHLAAAVGTRVIVPFGSTSPELTGPGLPGDTRHRLLCGNVPCAPCFLRVCPIDFRCMNAITTDDVAQALLDTVGTCS
jgi:heptosyltransferase II